MSDKTGLEKLREYADDYALNELEEIADQIEIESKDMRVMANRKGRVDMFDLCAASGSCAGGAGMSVDVNDFIETEITEARGLTVECIVHIDMQGLSDAVSEELDKQLLHEVATRNGYVKERTGHVAVNHGDHGPEPRFDGDAVETVGVEITD